MTPKIENLPVDHLVPYANNARTHSDEQVAQIAASIREFGFTNPVLVDKDGTIVAGHGRVLAARKLGMAKVPCLRLAHLTPHQVKAYVLADNRLALNAGWDEELLKVELTGLNELGFDTSILGFSQEEIDRMLADYDEVTTPEGVTEYDVEDFNKLNHRCPRCGFEFNG